MISRLATGIRAVPPSGSSSTSATGSRAPDSTRYALEGKALSGAQMDEIVGKVEYPGGRGPFRLLLRERGLHPDKGTRRTKGTKVDSKAVAKYLKG